MGFSVDINFPLQLIVNIAVVIVFLKLHTNMLNKNGLMTTDDQYDEIIETCRNTFLKKTEMKCFILIISWLNQKKYIDFHQ